jgi:transposase
MSKAYTSNLSLEEYELIAGMIPKCKPGGRQRSVSIWEVINAILYLLTQGCTWRNLPGDLPKWQTVYHYFRVWRIDGTWVKIMDHLRICVRVSQGREASPSEAMLDSQSVKTAAMLDEAIGFDAGKVIHGRKRFTAVDTLGLVLRAFVCAANVTEREGGKQVLKRVKKMGQSVRRIHTIWVDGGFDGEPFMQWVMDSLSWIVEAVLRPQGSKGFVLLPKRWVVERTFGWMMGCRRLARDYEGLPETSETFIYLAMIRIMVRRLAA